MKDNNEKVIKDAQYRKGLSIAFFNATNSAISLVAPREIADREEVLKEVCRIRDFFLEEHKNYYATVISNAGKNYDSLATIKKLRTAKNYQELSDIWLQITEDERRDGEIIKVARELREEMKNEKA